MRNWVGKFLLLSFTQEGSVISAQTRQTAAVPTAQVSEPNTIVWHKTPQQRQRSEATAHAASPALTFPAGTEQTRDLGTAKTKMLENGGVVLLRGETLPKTTSLKGNQHCTRKSYNLGESTL